MKKIFTLSLLLYICTCIFAQQIPSREEILNSYKNSMKEAKAFGDCGHILDGPLYLGKQLENTMLDLSLKVSVEDEKKIGKEVYDHMTRNKKRVSNHWKQQDIEQMVAKLCQGLERPAIQYKVSILESEEVNAFATLGGYIYITTGLLRFIESDDELAFILGHEISHIDLEHTLRKQKKMMVASSFGQMMNMEELLKLALDINLMLSAPFDQMDEYAADRNGFELASSAGYDINRFTDFFARLEKYQQKNILTKLLSTHPFPSDRKKCIQHYIDNSK